MVLTSACPLQCRHCEIWKAEVIHLPENLALEAVEQIASWNPGIHVQLTGGEPLCYPHLPALLQKLAERRLGVSLVTNGLLLNEVNLHLLQGLEQLNLVISVDGIGATHNYLRRREGLYAHLMRWLDRLDQATVSMQKTVISVLAVINEHNLDELPALVRLVDSHPVLRTINFQALAQPPSKETPHDPFWYRTHPLWPKDLRRLDRAIDTLIAMKQQGSRLHNTIVQLECYKLHFRDPNVFSANRCDIGSVSMTIDCIGQAYSCLPYGVYGRVGPVPLADLWNGPTASPQREGIRSCTMSCNRLINCNFLDNAPYLLRKILRWNEGSEPELQQFGPENLLPTSDPEGGSTPEIVRRLLWSYWGYRDQELKRHLAREVQGRTAQTPELAWTEEGGVILDLRLSPSVDRARLWLFDRQARCILHRFVRVSRPSGEAFTTGRLEFSPRGLNWGHGSPFQLYIAYHGSRTELPVAWGSSVLVPLTREEAGVALLQLPHRVTWEQERRHVPEPAFFEFSLQDRGRSTPQSFEVSAVFEVPSHYGLHCAFRLFRWLDVDGEYPLWGTDTGSLHLDLGEGGRYRLTLSLDCGSLCPGTYALRAELGSEQQVRSPESLLYHREVILTVKGQGARWRLSGEPWFAPVLR